MLSKHGCDARWTVLRPPGRVICRALDFFVTCDQLGAKRRAETQIPSALCERGLGCQIYTQGGVE